jgi:putative ABC transport system permease protein
MIGGLYGVMAYSVARRTREIGLRIALGATQWAVLSMVLKRALAHVLTGLLLGLLGASVAGQFLRGMLYDVTPLNPAVLGSACCLLGLTGIVAAYVPARRATKVDSMAALRYE